MSNKLSKSEIFLKGKSDVPTITSKMYKSVSAQRRDKMADQVENGLFSDGTERGSNTKNHTLTTNGNVVHGSNNIKMGQSFSSGASGGYRGAGDSIKQGPEIYSPLLLNSNLNLPRDKHTINAWCRTYFDLNPFVQNAITLHSTYPISKLNITCPDKKVENFFNEMNEELGLMNICVQIAQEYWLLGEAFPYADYDPVKGKWSRIVIQNPDHIIVEPSVIADEPNIFMRPDKNLQRIVNSNRPIDIEQRKQLNNHIIDCVRKGQNIPLESFNVSMLARKTSPYSLRGIGLPFSIFKQLMLFDKLRESKYAQADNMINPLTVVKIGSADFKPTFADLEQWRETFANAQYDKDFKIFTHEGVDITTVGKGTGIYDISNDITQIIKEIYIGLQVPSVLMDGGTDTTYANGGVALDVVKERYMSFRNMLSAWLKKKIFAPISRVQGFYDYKNGEKQLIVPDIDWNHMTLFDTDTYIGTLKELSAPTGDDGNKRVSVQSLYQATGLDFQNELRRKKQEAIQDAIFKKEIQSLSLMDLNELRALTDETEIPEKVQDADGDQVPGQENTSPDLGGGSPLPGEAAPSPIPSA